MASFEYHGSRFEDLAKSIEGESKRAQVLIIVAHYDDLLKDILKKFLKPPRNKPKDDELLGRNRAIDSFGARIALAYRLGLIAREDADALDVIRDIRNDCAHKSEIISLSTNQKQRCQNFAELVERGQDRFILRAYFPCSKDGDDFYLATMVLIIVLERILEKVSEIPSMDTPSIFTYEEEKGIDEGNGIH